MRYILLFFLLLTAPFFLTAQNLGLHPPKINWQQIDTDTVRVIFPAGYERQAQRVAKLVHRLQADHRRSIGEQYYKFDLVLQTENITPNAYVGLAPFRSELYTTPPQSFNQLGLTDWNDLLTIHEFRHVQQNSNERRGITKLASYLQGQYGWAVLSGIATPNWFSEGDAVVMETALTNNGRGRLPAFTRELRMMELQGIRYSYAKSRNGSFKDFVPDHYRYGYLQNVHARQQFGNDIWKKVLADGAAYKSLFYPFSSALKKHTGLTTPELYTQTLDAWNKDELLTKVELANRQTELLSPYHREPAQYRFPHPQKDGSIIALRATYSRTAELVRILPDLSVEVLTQIGFQREPYLDVQNGLAVWNETSQHPRYQNESYSDVVLYGIDSGAKRKLTKKGYFLSPGLSTDGKKIVAAVYHPTEGASLAVMDTRENPEIATYAASSTDYYAWPVFSPDGQTVYALDRRNSQLAIIRQSLTEGDQEVELLTPFTDDVKDNLTVGPKGKLYYSSPANGTDQIYRFDPASKAVYQLTAAISGAYQPGVGHAGQLVFATASPTGLNLARNVAGTQEKLYAPDQKIVTASGYAEEAINVLAEPFTDTDFPVRNFSDYLGGIKLHSWSYNGNYVNPGLIVEATNALNTVSFAADATYNYNEQRTGGGFTVGYGGLFPIIELGGRYTERSVLVGDPAFIDSLAVNRTDFNQLSLSASTYVPLRWLSGNYVVDLVPRVSFTRLQLSNRNRLDERLPDAFNSLGGRLQFRVLERTAVRQVQSRLGFNIDLRADGVLGGNDRGGSLLFRSQAFLPGLLRDHGIRIDLDLQKERLVNAYQFPDRMQYARGFYAPLNDNAYRIGFNYQLPLFYPDFGIAGITYFKRIRVNAFFDTGAFGLDFIEAKFAMRSSGAEIFFDNRWLNAQDITIGLQGAYRLTRDFFAPTGESDLRWRVLVEGSF